MSNAPTPPPAPPGQPPSQPPVPGGGNWYTRQSNTVKAAIVGAAGVVVAAGIALIPLVLNDNSPKEGDTTITDSECIVVGGANNYTCTEK
ncbi:hypothetical protein [Streptomyces fulvoviolaceus]|uniref:hypothetical protein n=1 Tax=Streptomyces fulvoviolaceus TaxID=285535 RepID=UPI00131E986E|nr:hypothetical protein [Streptomyces fulvoviolaceus]MCT9082118.1 hypothetical protein [Streptomyces fulvoviolaceus]